MSGWGYRRASGAMLIAVAVCWDCGASTPTIPTSTYSPITRDAAIDALEYWKSVLNINYTIVDYTSVDDLVPPIVVMYPSQVPTAHVGFAYVDEALNGLITRAEIAILQTLQCDRSLTYCSTVYRHEFGHALGFFAHSASGLMADGSTGPTLAPEDKAMMQALYSIPPGSTLDADGVWRNAALGVSGQLQDPSVVAAILNNNVNSWNELIKGQGCSPDRGFTCRSGEHLRVVLRQK